eukprot:362740-Chlamydomonas_euryale.AAC.1
MQSHGNLPHMSARDTGRHRAPALQLQKHFVPDRCRKQPCHGLLEGCHDAAAVAFASAAAIPAIAAAAAILPHLPLTLLLLLQKHVVPHVAPPSPAPHFWRRCPAENATINHQASKINHDAKTNPEQHHHAQPAGTASSPSYSCHMTNYASCQSPTACAKRANAPSFLPTFLLYKCTEQRGVSFGEFQQRATPVRTSTWAVVAATA